MTVRTVNGVPIKDVLTDYVYDPSIGERIPGRSDRKICLDIVEPDPRWPEYFQTFKSRILAAFESHPDEGQGKKVTVLSVNHVGSTSVPGLPAKECIDIDLVLSSSDLSSEPYYVPRLEAAGFEFRIREAAWHEHRFFASSQPISCNLHVWSSHSPEVERHRIFRDWLRANKDDKELYEKIKRESSAATTAKGEALIDYTRRKGGVIREILLRAFKSLGYLEEDGE